MLRIRKSSLALCITLTICALVTGQTPEVRPGPTYFGMCDASAAAVLEQSGFVVANDEDNVLRVFARRDGGLARTSFDLTAYLKPDPDSPETDIEGATWLNERIYWITSHGRNRDGEIRTSRYRLFATEFVRKNGRLTVAGVGTPYQRLVFDLISAAHLEKYDFAKASSRAPKSKDGLNIEGLTYTPAGHLWIAFRNPIQKGEAIIVPLLNPQKVLQSDSAELGQPIELDLDGRGLRSIEYLPDLGEYLILAGPADKGSIRLYRWSGMTSDKPRRIKDVKFGSLTPEAFVVYTGPSGLEVQFFSDDGTREFGGTACKTLEDANERCFRSAFWKGLNSLAP